MIRSPLLVVCFTLASLGSAPIGWTQNALPSAIPSVDPRPSAEPTSSALQQPGVSDSTASQPTEQDDAARLKLWSGPKMLEAREWLKLYFSRAKAITPQQAQTYMARLEKLSAPQMQEWLGRYQLEPRRAKVSQQTVERARQLSVEAALEAQDRMRRSYSSINQRQGAAGAIDVQRQAANARSLQNAQSRDATVVANAPGAAFNTGPYYLAFPPYAPYFAAATTPFPDGTANLSPREQADLADIQRSTVEPGQPIGGPAASPEPAEPPGEPQ